MWLMFKAGQRELDRKRKKEPESSTETGRDREMVTEKQRDP